MTGATVYSRRNRDRRLTPAQLTLAPPAVQRIRAELLDVAARLEVAADLNYPRQAARTLRLVAHELEALR